MPAATRSRSICHRSSRLRGSRPVVGSSRNSTVGYATTHAARSSRRRMPPEYDFTSLLPARRGRAGRAVRRPGRGRTLGEVVQAADQLEVQAAAQERIDRRLLRGDTDSLADLAGSRDDVEAGHRRPALGRLRQRREHPDRGGLAGAVVAEQSEHGAGRDVEVEVAQRPHVAELLAETLRRGPRDAGGRSSVDAVIDIVRMAYFCLRT